ncbi:hypothetical protein GCM10022226_61980 [Sphaerisporangium flaviroseum]|uniref:Uncharacterized protein n=1 Tax=Sphaerisporangium flaviroseum TaxID=509199 RepID=A0ABP7J2Z8_9ACTN
MVEALAPPVMTVGIWHNICVPDNFLQGWKPTHAMVKVFAYDIPAEQARDPHAVLEDAFVTFNEGDDDRARKYRARGNRSLSKGDVVVIGEVAWACASSGWDLIAGSITVCDVLADTYGARSSTPWEA